ncbi:MAG: hypothetical protein SV186_02480 [Candidatus Nanohaloarchaea archaeon]|nr:hypothetical protein [Candidatus Nanohaloarchaea archaeon]
MTDDAVIIGRFQPLHRGHDEGLIDYAQEAYDQVYLGVGVSGDEPTGHDPLYGDEREELLDEVYPDVEVFQVEDQGDNEAWVREVEDRVADYVEDGFVPVTGNEWTAECFEEFPETDYTVDLLEEEDMLDRDTYRGTRIREKIRDGEDWEHLVPEKVREQLDELGFAARVRRYG